MIRASVILPTWNHAETLLYSIPSALEQTVSDIEVLVIGDGAPSRTEEIVHGFLADPRVRWIPNPKSPGQGEEYRHRVLSYEARGRIVCYLSDDDLWFPDHVEVLERALLDADFAHTLPVGVFSDDVLGSWGPCNLEKGGHQEEIRQGRRNRIPFSAGAHTMEAYRRLPEGWAPTPPRIWTDLHFWRKFVALPGARLRSIQRPTTLHFPQKLHGGWSSKEALRTLERHLKMLREPAGRFNLMAGICGMLAQDLAVAEFRA